MAASTDQNAINRSIRDLRHFYMVGRKTLDEHEGQLPWKKGPRMAAAWGWNRDKLEKARQLAREMSKREFNLVCRKIEVGGFRVTVQHLARLLSVKDQKRRWRLIDQTIARKWSGRDLVMAIQRKGSSESPAGRKVRIRDEVDALAKLRAACGHWRRLLTAIRASGDEQANAKGSVEASWPKGVQTKLKDCEVLVGELHRRLRQMSGGIHL